MMNSAISMTSHSANISYVNEEDCNDYHDYMNPSYPDDDVTVSNREDSAALKFGMPVDRDSKFDPIASAVSQMQAAYLQCHTNNAVEDFENDETMSEEILRYVEKMEKQAAMREYNPTVSTITPSHASEVDGRLTKDEALKHALSPPPSNNDSPYFPSLSPSNLKGTPGQYLYLPKA